jgi:hypothetical protein
MSSAKSWAYPAAVIVAIEYATALLLGSRIGFNYSIPFVTYFVVGLTIAGSGISLWIVLLLAKYAWQREPHPSRRLLREGTPRFLAFLCAVVLVTLEMAVLMWLKIMLPIASPFWADPLLADVDAFIFGTDPWRLVHEYLGWAGPLLDRMYVTWAPAKFATLLFVFVQREDRRKTRAIVAYFLMVASSAIGQYSLSSGGPVFYERLGFGARFEELHFLPWVIAASNYLWVDYLNAGGNIGGGISAMPSLHVAVALWIALVVRADAPKVQVIGWLYFASIFIGSVYLGWHYAADSIVAVAIALFAWGISGAGARRFERRRTVLAS